jgi:hypothetical protein
LPNQMSSVNMGINVAYNTYAYDKIRAEAPRDLKYFESKFEARVEDSKDYRQCVRRMPYNMWDGRVPLNADVEVVPMKAIHLSIDNLDRLVREQDLIDQLMTDAEFGKKLWNQERTDRAVRNSNPAVEKAYQKYVMLLELARK